MLNNTVSTNRPCVQCLVSFEQGYTTSLHMLDLVKCVSNTADCISSQLVTSCSYNFYLVQPVRRRFNQPLLLGPLSLISVWPEILLMKGAFLNHHRRPLISYIFYKMYCFRSGEQRDQTRVTEYNAPRSNYTSARRSIEALYLATSLA